MFCRSLHKSPQTGFVICTSSIKILQVDWENSSNTKICLTGDTIRRIDIVSRCLENKNNNCCETKFVKMPFVNYLQNTNPYLATLRIVRPGIRVARSWIYFVNNKQMAFCKVLFHNNYCFFLIFKTSGYNVDLTDCVSSETDL